MQRSLPRVPRSVARAGQGTTTTPIAESDRLVDSRGGPSEGCSRRGRRRRIRTRWLPRRRTVLDLASTGGSCMGHRWIPFTHNSLVRATMAGKSMGAVSTDGVGSIVFGGLARVWIGGSAPAWVGFIGAMERQGDLESAPNPVWRVAQVQGSAQGAREVAGDGQAEPAAAGVGGPGFVESGESLEHTVAVHLRDSRPIVIDVDHQQMRSVVDRDLHGRDRVALRVFDEVDHDTAKVGGSQVSRERIGRQSA